jgi:hypothetical protein
MARLARLLVVVTVAALAAGSCGGEALRRDSAAGTTGAGGATAATASSSAGTGGAGGTGGTGGATGGSMVCTDAGAPSEPCTTDTDCEWFPAPCPACANGARVCAALTCQGGACTAVPPVCLTCTPADCGASCLLACDQNGCTDAVCDTNGQCVAPPGPACGPKCMMDTDCAQPGGPCLMCPGGPMVCEKTICEYGYCKPVPPKCPAVSCTGQICGTACVASPQTIGLCDGVDTCVVVTSPPLPGSFCKAGCLSPYDCPGGFGIFMMWDGCVSTDLAACTLGKCGHLPTTCKPSYACNGVAAGMPCLPLCAEVGCPTPNPLPSAHCDWSGTCVVDPAPSCGPSVACAKNADCPTFVSPWFDLCPSPNDCLMPICVEGACATFVTQARQASCSPMDAHSGPPTCPSQTQGFAWDGTACVPLLHCACAGQDCDALMPSLAVCKALHEQC